MHFSEDKYIGEGVFSEGKAFPGAPRCICFFLEILDRNNGDGTIHQLLHGWPLLEKYGLRILIINVDLFC